MKKWITFAIRATCILVLIAAVSDILTLESTKRTSRTSVCANCLAQRRTVSRQIMWRVVEDRDTIYPLPDNEKVDCPHDWIPLGGGSTFGLGGQSTWSGRSSDPRFPKRNAAVKEYEQRTRRSYGEEVRKIYELDRKTSEP